MGKPFREVTKEHGGVWRPFKAIAEVLHGTQRGG